jgi:branched-chain amino acid transport system permease protein
MKTIARSSLVAVAMFAVPLAVVALVGVTLLSAADERTVLSFFVTLVLALSIQAFSGPSGIMSFGHVAFMGVGAYVGALLVVSPAVKASIAPGLPHFVLQAHLPFGVALVAGLLAGALVAGVLGLVFARMSEDAMSMATLSLLLIFGVVFDSAAKFTGGAQGIYGIPQATTMWIAFGVALLAIFVGQVFTRSKIGMQLRASRSSVVAAQSLGVRIIRLRWIAWTLAGALVGLGGALWAGSAIAFTPEEFGLELTFSILAALVVGGLFSVTGTVVGVAVLTVAFEVTRRIEESSGLVGLSQIAVSIGILVLLYWRPHGIIPTAELPEALSRLRPRQRAGS